MFSFIYENKFLFKYLFNSSFISSKKFACNDNMYDSTIKYNSELDGLIPEKTRSFRKLWRNISTFTQMLGILFNPDNISKYLSKTSYRHFKESLKSSYLRSLALYNFFYISFAFCKSS